MSDTMKLDSVEWDLTVDGLGNIASVTGPDALAQDAASAIRLFKGELWFDTSQGVPYFAKILSRRPPIALMKAYFVAAAKTVPGVASAICYISAVTNRGVSGQVQVKDAAGNPGAASF